MQIHKLDKNKSKYLFLILLIVFIVGGIFSCVSITKSNHEVPPNVVVILTDDQGWGDLSLSGNIILNTPNIDRLAKNGATFDRFYVSPVCSPTRAEILTGRYHVRSGVYSTSQGGERLDLDEMTIAEIFKKNGYKTAAYGKWHNGMQYPYHPNARGFDDFYGFCSGHWGNYFSPILEHNGQLVKGEGFLTDDLTNHALDFITENKDTPFFLYVPLNTPHSPMQVPDRWWNKYENLELPNDHPNRDKEDLNHTKAAYAMCENIDWNVGRIMEKLGQLELEENTIIVFLSDNGPNGWRWNGGMKGIKGHTDEGGVRSPCIIQWKGVVDSNEKVSQIAGAIDLLPTLVDLTNIEFTSINPIDGLSLKSLLMKENIVWEDRNIVSHWRGNINLRNQRFRLDDLNNLYDMTNDPGQEKNVSQLFPSVFEEMLIFKNQWIKEVLSELPNEDLRFIPVAHPDFQYTQLPARDATAHGDIKRSNRWPNCSFFTNWVNEKDSITWEIEVLESGKYNAKVYYTCSKESNGSSISLGFGPNSIKKQITISHNPPLVGSENDRVERQESYVKDFIPLEMGTIYLEKGIGTLVLKSPEIKGGKSIDFRMLMIENMKTN